jgi:5-methylcytosine-specific restriction endonuclease McrA
MRKRGTDRDGCSFDSKRVQEVWNRGGKIPGKDPDLYRRDSKGNELYRHAYGKHGDQSWQVDHKVPVAKGGSDNLRNLQPLQSGANAEKGDKLER